MRLLVLALAGMAFLVIPGQEDDRAQGQVTVTVGDFFFCDDSLPPETCVTTVSAGDTVVWDYTTGIEGHTVTHCGDSCDLPTTPLWDSGPMGPGAKFSFTFDTPGTFLYYCRFHPEAMRATIVVRAQPTPTPTPVPTVTPVSSPPAANGDGGVSPLWFVLAGVGGAIVILGGGAALLRRRA